MFVQHGSAHLPPPENARGGALMKPKFLFLALSLLIGSAAIADSIKLPAPDTTGRGTIEASLHDRRSIRTYDTAAPMSLREASQLLWAAQGITASNGHRTAPSAGATYPLEVYIVALEVNGLSDGIYHYRPQTHSLDLVAAGDRRTQVVTAAKGQTSVAQAPAVFVITAVSSRTAARYAARTDRYVAIESGAAAENLALQAVALNLGTCYVGAFDDAAVASLLGLGEGEIPMIVLPAGRPK